MRGGDRVSFRRSIRALRRRGLDVENDDGATYLRLPLERRTPNHATLSKRVADDPGAARDACAVLADDATARSLASSLERARVTVKKEDKKAEEEELLVDVRVATSTGKPTTSKPAGSKPEGASKPAGSKLTPRTIADDKEWRRSTFASLFGGGNAARAAHVATIRERAGDEPETTDEWVIGAAIGVGRARDMALDRKHANHAWLPLAFAATHALRDVERVDPSAPPYAGDGEDSPPPPRAPCRGREPPKTRTPGSGLCVSGGFPADADERSRRALAGDPVASALARAPAIVSAYFAVSRAEGRTLAGFVEPDADDADVFAATRREWNRAMCACVVTAYATMVTHARLEMTPSLPAEAFDAAWPTSESLGLPPPPALDAEGRVDGLGRSQSSGSHPASSCS